MKPSNNFTFKSWRTWFELSTIVLAIAILIVINVRTTETVILTSILLINWIVSVAIALRRY